ncbi:hypothetical protein RI367_002233 [Sorochytrium milnesiophthora]
MRQTLDELEFDRSIHKACVDGNLGRVQALLAKDTMLASQIDGSGYTPLLYAARQGNVEIISLLLEAGADINAHTRELRATPLQRATTAGKVHAVQRLLAVPGVCIGHIDSDGNTVLHRACATGDEALVSMLVQYADSDLLQVTNKHGQTCWDMLADPTLRQRIAINSDTATMT